MQYDYFFPAFSSDPGPGLAAEKEKRNISRLCLGIALIPVLSFVSQLVLLMLVSFFRPTNELPGWALIAISSLSMYAVAMPLAYLLLRTVPSEAPQRERLSAPLSLGTLAVSLALTFLGSIIGTFVNILLSALTGHDFTNPVATLTEQTPIWALILFVVIMAPVMEELVFRKLIIDRLRRYGDLPAILLSGLIFGIIHGNFSQFFYATMLGVFFGFIYCRTGSLVPTTLLHIFINFFGSVYSTLMLEKLGDIPDVPDTAYIAEHLTGFLMMGGYYLLFGIAFLGALFAMVPLVRRLRPRPMSDLLPRTEWSRIVFGNFFVWLLAVVLLGNFLMNSL